MEVAVIILVSFTLFFLFLSIALTGYMIYLFNKSQKEFQNKQETLTKEFQKREEEISKSFGDWIKILADQLKERDGMFASAIKDVYEELQVNSEILEAVNSNTQRVLSQRNLVDVEDIMSRR